MQEYQSNTIIRGSWTFQCNIVQTDSRVVIVEETVADELQRDSRLADAAVAQHDDFVDSGAPGATSAPAASALHGVAPESARPAPRYTLQARGERETERGHFYQPEFSIFTIHFRARRCFVENTRLNCVIFQVCLLKLDDSVMNRRLVLINSWN